MQVSVAIIGAGPAGLTAGYMLAKQGVSVVILESDPDYVGGIARTVVYKGYCFDIGGHRFFSKSQEIEDFWSEILPDDMLVRPRSSRIFYKNKFFSYPLNIKEVLQKLGIVESACCFFSYIKSKLLPIKSPYSFSSWVTNHFGRRLFNIFFKTYTEKVWGMSCDEISADWAAQRIKGLSLGSAILNSVLPHRKTSKDKVIKTLINTFRYPRKGPGMMWEVCAEKIKQLNGKVLLNSKVSRCTNSNNEWTVEYVDNQGVIKTLTAQHVISSAPLRELVNDYFPTVSKELSQAAEQLHYRDFLIVVLILKEKNQFTDNWIYIHDPSVDVARIQNFKSWSPEMVPDASTCCYGMEYFCFEGDGVWNMADQDLMRKAKEELVKIGLAMSEDILDGCVVRQPKAYPVYDQAYKENVNYIRDQLAEIYPSLYLVGRNGMHKYNNQDHAMMTAMLTVKNILSGSNQFDVWNVNQDAEYIEELREVPTKI